MKTILTIKDLKKAIKLLADDDQVCLETVDKNGDTIDLFNFHVDVIDNIKLTNDRIVKEIRFCQENHQKHSAMKTIEHLINAYNNIIAYAYQHAKENGVEIDDSHHYLDSIGYDLTPEEVAGYYMQSRSNPTHNAYSDWLSNIEGKKMDTNMRSITKLLAKLDTKY